MRVVGVHHDVLPKLGLDDNYLGDGVQLCVDVPSKSFFRKGARFINIGSRPPSDGTIPGDLDPTKTNFKYGPNGKCSNSFLSIHSSFIVYILTSFKHILYFLKYITNLHRDQPVHLLLLFIKDWYRIRLHLNYMVLCVEIKMSPIQNVPLLRKLL